MLEVIENYLLLKKQIAQLIKKSGYRNEFIASKIGMRADYFAVKKQRGNWTPDELEKLLAIISNEDVEEYLMLEEMRSRKDDETITFEEYKKVIAKWK